MQPLPKGRQPFKEVSASVLSHVAKMLTVKEGFARFRGISQKFNQCFLTYAQRRARGIQIAMKEYEGTTIVQETKTEIENNLTMVKRINDLAVDVIKEDKSDSICSKLLSRAICILE